MYIGTKTVEEWTAYAAEGGITDAIMLLKWSRSGELLPIAIVFSEEYLKNADGGIEFGSKGEIIRWWLDGKCYEV